MISGRKLKLKREGAAGDENVLPLINVVFLLLIFFMIAGQLVNADPFKLTPARSLSTAKDTSKIAILHMSETGRIAFNHREIEPVDLPDILKTYFDPHAGREVRLKVDGAHKAQHVLAFLTILREYGVEKVSLITMKKEGR